MTKWIFLGSDVLNQISDGILTFYDQKYIYIPKKIVRTHRGPILEANIGENHDCLIFQSILGFQSKFVSGPYNLAQEGGNPKILVIFFGEKLYPGVFSGAEHE